MQYKDFYKSLLTEDPNRIEVTPGNNKTLIQKGYPNLAAALRFAYFDSEGAISFIQVLRDKEILYNEGDNGEGITHPDMGEQIVHFWANPDKFILGNASHGQGAFMAPNEDFDVGPGGSEGTIFSLNIKRAGDFKEYLNSLDAIIPLDGAIPKQDTNFTMGRLWTAQKTVSFWKAKPECLKHMDEVFKLLKVYDIDPKEAVYEFLDRKHLFTFDELETEHGVVRSDAEQIELMKQQHLNPAAKKKLAKKNGGLKQKKDVGFDFQAQRNAAMPALEEGYINEDPDLVISPNKRAFWHDHGALAFFAWPECSLLGKTHGKTMQAVYDHATWSNQPIDTLQDYTGIKVNGEEALEYFMKNSGELKKVLSSKRNAGLYARALKIPLLGRVWPQDKIMSFWNTKIDVLNKWTNIRKMFQDSKDEIGNIEDYEIDWLERAKTSLHDPLESTTSVEASLKSQHGGEKGQTNFMDKLMSAPDALSDAEIKAIRAKLHVMSPAEKRKALIALGVTNNKKAKIADALGMSVAEFNHIMRVNEGNDVLNLKDCIPNISK